MRAHEAVFLGSSTAVLIWAITSMDLVFIDICGNVVKTVIQQWIPGI